MRNKKILILGSAGQVGKRLVEIFTRNNSVFLFQRSDLYLNLVDNIRGKILSVNPELSYKA